MQPKRTFAVTLGIVVLMAVAAFSHLGSSNEVEAAAPFKDSAHGKFRIIDTKDGAFLLDTTTEKKLAFQCAQIKLD